MRSKHLFTVGIYMLSLLCLTGLTAAHAAWTDSGWTSTVSSSSSSGYVVNTQTPGASAVAPSAGLTSTFITATYTNTMSANGANYDVNIAWTYSLSGSVNTVGSANSSFSWSNGNAGGSQSGAGSYSFGPTTETGQDTVVHPSGGTVTVVVNASASTSTYPVAGSASASGSGNGAYTP